MSTRETDWEARYRAGDTPWDKGEPNPALLQFLQRHPEFTGRSVCVPGCGVGHDAKAWAAAGNVVEGIDLSPTAIARCRETHALENLAFNQADFLRDTPAEPFDVVFEHTLYCAIDPERRDDYVAAVHRWLKPDGRFIAVHYLLTDADGPPFGCDRDEILRRFGDTLRLIADWEPDSWPHRKGLERMFHWQKTG